MKGARVVGALKGAGIGDTRLEVPLYAYYLLTPCIYRLAIYRWRFMMFYGYLVKYGLLSIIIP